MSRLVVGSTLPTQQIRIVGYEGDLQGSTVTGTIRQAKELEPRSIQGSMSVESGNILNWQPHEEDISKVGINYLQFTFVKSGKPLHTELAKLELLPLQKVSE